MTPQEKLKRLFPSHDHFEQVEDPWHVDAFAGIQGVDFSKGSVIPISNGPNFTVRRGTRRKVWYSVDRCGNLIQEWGEDTPPGCK